MATISFDERVIVKNPKMIEQIKRDMKKSSKKRNNNLSSFVMPEILDEKKADEWFKDFTLKGNKK